MGKMNFFWMSTFTLAAQEIRGSGKVPKVDLSCVRDRL